MLSIIFSNPFTLFGYYRFAKYYKQANGKEERTLIKAYGIRFDILVFGTVNAVLFSFLLLTFGSRERLVLLFCSK